MMFVTYIRDPIKIRARGECPSGDAICTVLCDDGAMVTLKDNILRIKGTDVDTAIFAVKSVTVVTENSVA